MEQTQDRLERSYRQSHVTGRTSGPGVFQTTCGHWRAGSEWGIGLGTPGRTEHSCDFSLFWGGEATVPPQVPSLGEQAPLMALAGRAQPLG